MIDEDEEAPPHTNRPSQRSSLEPPEHGVRIEVVLEENERKRAIYRGSATTPTHRLRLEVISEVDRATAKVDPPTDGASLSGDSIAAIEKVSAALVRAATRAELAEGIPLPRKITRWRAL